MNLEVNIQVKYNTFLLDLTLVVNYLVGRKLEKGRSPVHVGSKQDLLSISNYTTSSRLFIILLNLCKVSGTPLEPSSLYFYIVNNKTHRPPLETYSNEDFG